MAREPAGRGTIDGSLLDGQLPSADGLTVVQEGRVLHVTIDRGDENLMSMAMCEALTTLLRHPPNDCHVLHLRAAGPVFCLGRDRGAGDADGLRAETETLVALNRALSEGNVVTVTEVAGDAAGFGVGLVALSDISLVAPSARFWFPEVEAGLAPTVVLTWLPRLVGRTRAFRLTATAEPIDGLEAARLGLVTHAASSDGVVGEETEAEIASLLAHPLRTHLEIRAFLADAANAGPQVLDRLAVDRLVLGALHLRSASAHALHAQTDPAPRHES